MGGDGGSIPRRIDQVKTKRKQQRLERDLENAIKWRLCTLTQQPLKLPIVSCELGRLYSKEAIIEALLQKNVGDSDVTKHIRSLKDIKTLNLTTNPQYDPEKIDKGGEYCDNNLSQFVCPITGLEMNGMHRFVVLWNCGCVLSEKAIKEIKSDGCQKCGHACDFDLDVVILNPAVGEELGQQREQMQQRRARVRAEKKSKKKTAECASPKNEPVASTSMATTNESIKKSASLKRHAVDFDASSSSSSATIAKNPSMSGSVQDDPNASRVFKSLFTSSDAAKSRRTAKSQQLWVSYNPQFY